MNVILRTCRVDTSGIPDLSDLGQIKLATESLRGVTRHIGMALADESAPRFFPYATVELADGSLHVVPLDSVASIGEAEHALQILSNAMIIDDK